MNADELAVCKAGRLRAGSRANIKLHSPGTHIPDDEEDTWWWKGERKSASGWEGGRNELWTSRERVVVVVVSALPPLTTLDSSLARLCRKICQKLFVKIVCKSCSKQSILSVKFKERLELKGIISIKNNTMRWDKPSFLKRAEVW